MSSIPKKSSTSSARSSKNVNGSVEGPSAALADGVQTWLAVSREYQREMMDFVSMRLVKDGDTMREILATKNLADAAAAQSRWMEETLRDYSAQMAKVMAIHMKAGGGRGENP